MLIISKYHQDYLVLSDNYISTTIEQNDIILLNISGFFLNGSNQTWELDYIAERYPTAFDKFDVLFL